MKKLVCVLSNGMMVSEQQREAVAFLVAALAPMAVIGGIFGTICSPMMTTTAKIFYPLFDVALTISIWWSYKHGGFRDQ